MFRFETNRLLLQPFAQSDLAYLHELWTEPLVRRFLWDDLVISREQAEEVIKASQESFNQFRFGFWRVDLKTIASPIGFCGLRHFSNSHAGTDRVEILYGLNPNYWGNGFAIEAAQRILHFGFAELGLRQIFAGADSPNKAPFRVMEQLGMCFDHETEMNGLSTCYLVMTREAYFTRQT